MADITKLLRYVGGFHKEVDLNGGTDILKVSSVKIGSNSAEITTAIADKLVKISSTANGDSGADQIGATTIRTFSTVQGILGKLSTDLGTAESTLSTHVANTSNPHSVTKAQVGLGNVDNTSDADKPVSTAQQTALNLKIDNTEKGVANGVATLDATGKLPLSQLSPSALVYKGLWAASTNTPALANTDTGKNGYFYIASDSGDVDFGAGSIHFDAGDWVINNGTVWQVSHNATEVNSVNGFTGNVVLKTVNIAEDTNLYFTDSRAKAAAVADSITNGVTDVAPSQNAVFDALALKADDSVVVKTVNGQSPVAGAVTVTTTNVAEGTNLYYTTERAQDDIAAMLIDTDTIDFTYTDATPELKADVKDGSITAAKIASTVDANTFKLSAGYVATSGAIIPADTIQDAIAKLDARSSVQVVTVTLKNSTGSTIQAGSIVCLSTTVAGEIVLANASSQATSEGVVGVAIANILDGFTGQIQIAGEVTVANGGNAFDLGKSVYLSTTPGEATKTAPAGNVIRIGKASATGKVVLNVEIVLIA